MFSLESMNELKWHVRWLGAAKWFSLCSKDPSTKCGAVIVRPDKTLASVGFNGFPKGCDDSPEIYANRELKYARVIHAETNALHFCTESCIGYTMYTWPAGYGPSCERCSTNIIQRGITKVVHVFSNNAEMNDRWKKSSDIGLQLYREAGVEVVDLPESILSMIPDFVVDGRVLTAL
jgi:dCMP deaminase